MIIQKQKLGYFDKIWFLSLIGIIITIIYLYMDFTMIEFQVFDQISLFL